MKDFYPLFIVLLLFSSCRSQNTDSSSKPNVLFIAVDDMNDWVSVLGHEQVKTPNIERLASRGMLFTNAHCNAPVCNPSRVSLLTGKHPFSTGVYENQTRMRDKIPNVITLPQYYRQHGYKVFGGGKIFHDPPPHNHDPQSFEEYYWWNEHGPKGAKNGNRWRSPYSVPPDPELQGRPIHQITPLTKRNFDWGGVDQPEENWPDHKVTSWASKILNRNHDQPFFLAVGIFRPHVPWFNPSKYPDLYPIDQIKLPQVKENDLDDVGLAAQTRAKDNASKHSKVIEFGEWEEAVQAYLASISFADASLGRVLDALDASPYKDKTIIVFWSDHGYHLGEKMHWHKRTLWERSTHVPLIFSVPEGVQAVQSHVPVSLIDIYPTLLDLCGLSPNKELEGHSLLPFFQNPDYSWDYPVITTASPGCYAIRDKEWRFIQYANGEQELYSHKNDALEWNNLIADSKYQHIVEKLQTWIPNSTEIADGPLNLNRSLFGIQE